MEETPSMATGVAERGRVVDHTFAAQRRVRTRRLQWLVEGIARAMADDGYTEVDRPGPEVQVVLHRVDVANPRPYRRKNAPTFVVAMGYLDAPPTDLLRTGYPILVRGLANLAVLLSGHGHLVPLLDSGIDPDVFREARARSSRPACGRNVRGSSA